jgi:predicted aminopeptidase
MGRMTLKGSFSVFVPPLVTALFTALALPLFSGCYTLKQGAAMLGYLGKAVPPEKLDTSQNQEAAAFVARVADIRRFAMEELGLKESKNYTRYVEIDRDYLAAVVSGCAADSFTRHEWQFPVVGTVPYKGFFNEEDAKKEAAKLKGRGLDVWVRRVDAFSTLGWFKDPLYSYMKEYSDYQLADLLIHELLHATVFVRGRVQFNEQLAEFVGTYGARLYIESRFGADSAEYRDIDSHSADHKAYRLFLVDLCKELDAVYTRSDLDRDAKLAEKERIIKAAQGRFDKEYKTRFQSDNYRGFSSIQVNNAYLDLYRLYYEEDNFIANLYEKTPDPVIAPEIPEKLNVTNPGIQKLRSFIISASLLNNSREARKDPRKALTSILFP